MARKPPDSLAVRKAIEAGKFPPVWLWSGPEDFLKQELFGRLAEIVGGGDLGALNVGRYRAGGDDLDAVLTTCLTLPMLAERRLVLLQGIEKLGRKERESLAAYVAHPSPETVLVLTGDKGPRDPFHGKLASAGAEAAVFWVPFEDQTRQWIQIRFRDLGKQCDPRTAQTLLERCGGGSGDKVSLGDIAPEIEKVALGLGEQTEVRPEDLEVIGRKADEDLLGRVVARATVGDVAGALEALDGALLFKSNPEIRIVATLTHRFILLRKVRDLLDTGMPPADVKREARVWPAEAWPLVERGVRGRSRRDLARGIRALTQADKDLKSRPKNPRWVLEQAILALAPQASATSAGRF